ncbi:hypothetical protein E3N88_20587 [Mikania micrantha]|uniref:Uncharacterized protein n=1 Tax=Mikania micrantha TaxID=192012 RepID=A0A5N6NHU4_9ASTR|nr:hypothetical protein E3N88_20587 [Mikania micrantha]
MPVSSSFLGQHNLAFFSNPLKLDVYSQHHKRNPTTTDCFKAMAVSSPAGVNRRSTCDCGVDTMKGCVKEKLLCVKEKTHEKENPNFVSLE